LNFKIHNYKLHLICPSVSSCKRIQLSTNIGIFPTHMHMLQHKIVLLYQLFFLSQSLFSSLNKTVSILFQTTFSTIHRLLLLQTRTRRRSPLLWYWLSPPFSGIDASIVVSVRPASEGLSSTFTAAENGSVWIAHGGQVSSYDWNLFHSITLRTHLDEINSICRVSPEIAAAGTEFVAGNYFKLHKKNVVLFMICFFIETHMKLCLSGGALNSNSLIICFINFVLKVNMW